jgi:two-component system sensor histidine kinase VanS
MKQKKKSSNLKKNLLKQYLFRCFIWTAGLFAVSFVGNTALIWILNFFDPMYYWYYRSLYFGIAALLVWFIGFFYLTYRLVKTVSSYVDELYEAAGQLFNKETDYVELSPELGELALQLNHLKQEASRNALLAKENEQRKNDLIMYLAHDLKTPLSSVIGYLTLLRDETSLSEERREKYLEISLEKAECLEDLINEFFEITRFNLSEVTLQYMKIDLTRLLEQLIYEFQPMLKEKNLQCELQGEGKILMSCDANKIQRVFDNLLRNAVIYSFPNTKILITAECRGDQAVISFENEGNLIPQEKLKRIFEQFYRLDAARSTQTGNAGLGLAIARQIVELHNGSISAESEQGHTTFTVILPLALRKN